MNLSKRLDSILSFIPKGSRVADIGTDHGYLIVKAILDKRALHGYGLDIAPLPLSQAEKTVSLHGLESQIDLQLSDGLRSFTGDADCFVMAGMGAETIYDIISAYSFVEGDTIIVQSNTKNPWLRKSVVDRGFEIVQEAFLIDKSIPVFVIVFKYICVCTKLSEDDQYLGPILRTQNNQEYYEYLKERQLHLNNIKKHNTEAELEYNIVSRYLEKEIIKYE